MYADVVRRSLASARKAQESALLNSTNKSTKSSSILDLATPAAVDVTLGALIKEAIELEGQYDDDHATVHSDPVDFFGLQPPVPPPSVLSSASEPDPNPRPTKRKKPLPASVKDRKRWSKADKKKRAHSFLDVSSSHLPRHNMSVDVVSTTLSSIDLPAASSGFVGVNPHTRTKKALEGLLQDGFPLLKHDGKNHLITDSEGRAVGKVLVGPAGDSWQENIDLCGALMKDYGQRLKPSTPKKDANMRPIPSTRGKFLAVGAGISHGGGTKHPQNMAQTPNNAKLMDELCSHPAFERIALHTAVGFATFAPRLYTYYLVNLLALLLWNPLLVPLFGGRTPWTAGVWNCGPVTVTERHTDFGNLAFGVCAITALGPNFKWAKGGHLILWNLKLVVEFPPGTTIIIPSGSCEHSNIPIQPGEERYSFTQYTPGQIFGFIDRGFKTEKDFVAQASSEELAEAQNRKASRWKMGLGLFSTVDELT